MTWGRRGGRGPPTEGSRCNTGIHTFLIVLLLVYAVDAQKDKATNKKGNFEGAADATDLLDEEETATSPPLTGDPQKDYIHDPNLPHELMNYDLSDYPFYKRVPKEGHNFTCDNRLDGFYAAVPHKCQVYYNCLFGLRYDFLCPNYTVFDQVNFICHYASEVDCDNSERYYDRNKELYVTTTTTTPAPPQIIYVDRPRPRPIRPLNNRRPTPLRRRNRPNARPRRPPVQAEPEQTTPAQDAPVQQQKSNLDAQYYDYYDNNNNDYYYDDYYYDDAPLQPPTTTTTTTTTPRPIRRRINRPGVGGGGRRRGVDGGRIGPGGRRRRLRPRGGSPGGQAAVRRRRVKTTTTTSTAAPAEYSDYLDDYYYYDDVIYKDNAPALAPVRPNQSPVQKKVAAPRSKPGQIRKPNFRRPQGAVDPSVGTPALNETIVQLSNIQQEVNDPVEEFQSENQQVAQEDINRRQSSRVPASSSQRVFSRPTSNSRSGVPGRDRELPVPVSVNRQGNLVNSNQQTQAANSHRLQKFRITSQSEPPVIE